MKLNFKSAKGTLYLIWIFFHVVYIQYSNKIDILAMLINGYKFEI